MKHIVRCLILWLIYSNSCFAVGLPTFLDLVSQNEAWKISEKDIDLARTQIKELRSSVLPNVSLNGSLSYQESQTTFTEDQQSALTLQVMQPLWHNFKEFKALDAAEMQLKAQKLLAETVHRELKQRVVNTYFQVLSLRQDLLLSKELYELSLNREKDLGERVRIGKSRSSDLLSSQAQTLTVKGDLERLESNYQVALIQLTRLIQFSKEAESIEGSLKEPSAIDPPAPDGDIWKDYPGTLAANMLEDVAQKQISIERSDYWPSLDLRGNYYAHQEGQFNQRDWDVSINLTFPLYEGGATVAQVESATINWKKARLQAKEVKNDLKENIKSIYTRYKLGKNRLGVMKKAVATSRRNYEVIVKDYRLGLVTNLDVNSALNQYITEKKAYEALRYEVLNTAYQLQILAEGKL